MRFTWCSNIMIYILITRIQAHHKYIIIIYNRIAWEPQQIHYINRCWPFVFVNVLIMFHLNHLLHFNARSGACLTLDWISYYQYSEQVVYHRSQVQHELLAHCHTSKAMFFKWIMACNRNFGAWMNISFARHFLSTLYLYI